MVNTLRLKKLLKTGIFSLLFLTGIILSGCDADDQLGLDIQPPGDELNTLKTDTFAIFAHSRLADSVRSDETAQSLAGYYTDPIFGPLKASFCTQLRLSSNDVDFGDNVVIDSVVLHLEYYNVYGNAKQNNKMTFEVYELEEPIYLDSAYYSFSTIETGQKIGSKSFAPNMNDSVYMGGEVLAPQLRIPLSKNFGKRMVDASTQGYLSSSAAFEDFCHGICVVPTNGNTHGSIISFDVMSANSGLTIYYHNDVDTLGFKFNINQGTARFNHFNHFGFLNGDPSLLGQLSGDTTLGQQKLFLQPLGGAEIDLQIPNLKSLNSDFSVVIHRAELFIPVDQTDHTQDYFPRPVKLLLVGKDKNGENVNLIDYTLNANTANEGKYYNGTYDKTTGCYRFIITRHVQNVITGGEDNYGFSLLVRGSAIYGNRVVLNGPDSENGLRLEVSYTLVE